MPNGEQPHAAQPNTSDAHENEVDYVITSDESNLADRASHSRNERLIDDVTTRNEASEQSRNEEPDWPNPAIFPRSHRKSLPDTADSLKDKKIFPDENFRTESVHKILRKRGMVLSCPKYLKTMLEMKV